MILDAEHPVRLVGKPFAGVVVEVDMRHFHPCRRKAFHVHAKPVVLRRDPQYRLFQGS